MLYYGVPRTSSKPNPRKHARADCPALDIASEVRPLSWRAAKKRKPCRWCCKPKEATA